jgi:hypothetical protein
VITLKEIEFLTAGLSEEELAYWEQLELQAQAEAEAPGAGQAARLNPIAF